MDVFGSFALLLAFICAVYAFVGGIAAIYTRHPLLVKSARQAGLATCGLIFLATGSLVYLFFSDSLLGLRLFQFELKLLNLDDGLLALGAEDHAAQLLDDQL